jgi:hypothetical protein
MEKGGLAIFHSNDIMPTSADGSMPFKQASDIFYLSGIDQEETILLLFPDAVDRRTGRSSSCARPASTSRSGKAPSSARRKRRS